MSINGKAVKADIKVINGTPYIPLTALSSNLKVITIKHDAKSGTIKIDEPKTAEPPKTPAIGLGRNNPAPIGTTVTFAKKDIFDNYQISIKVEQIIRGADAWDLIKAANMFNGEPPAGYEYLLAKLSVSVVSNAKQDAQIGISAVSFTLVSATGKDYGYVSVVDPDPSINADLYVGASNTGWGSYLVKTDDANPILTYGRNYDGTGGVWLKTN